MGNDKSSIKGTIIGGKSSQVTFIQDWKMRGFGDVKLLEILNLPRTIVAIPCSNLLIDPSKRIDIKHPNFSGVVAFDSENSLFWNQTTYFFEYIEVSLDEILAQRRLQNLRFPETDLLRIAKEVLTCLSHLQSQHNIPIPCINPTTLFLDNHDNCIKLYDNQLIFGDHFIYKQLHQSQAQHQNSTSSQTLNPQQAHLLYCTPEVMYARKFNETSILEQFKHEQDIFSFGLTLLELATFKESAMLCDVPNLRILTTEIDSRLNDLRTLYSNQIEQLIRDMLVIDPRKRPPAHTLLQQIEQPTIPNQISPTRIPFSPKPVLPLLPIAEKVSARNITFADLSPSLSSSRQHLTPTTRLFNPLLVLNTNQQQQQMGIPAFSNQLQGIEQHQQQANPVSAIPISFNGASPRRQHSPSLQQPINSHNKQPLTFSAIDSKISSVLSSNRLAAAAQESSQKLLKLSNSSNNNQSNQIEQHQQQQQHHLPNQSLHQQSEQYDYPIASSTPAPPYSSNILLPSTNSHNHLPNYSEKQRFPTPTYIRSATPNRITKNPHLNLTMNNNPSNTSFTQLPTSPKPTISPTRIRPAQLTAKNGIHLLNQQQQQQQQQQRPTSPTTMQTNLIGLMKSSSRIGIGITKPKREISTTCNVPISHGDQADVQDSPQQSKSSRLMINTSVAQQPTRIALKELKAQSESNLIPSESPFQQKQQWNPLFTPHILSQQTTLKQQQQQSSPPSRSLSPVHIPSRISTPPKSYFQPLNITSTRSPSSFDQQLHQQQHQQNSVLLPSSSKNINNFHNRNPSNNSIGFSQRINQYDYNSTPKATSNFYFPKQSPYTRNQPSFNKWNNVNQNSENISPSKSQLNHSNSTNFFDTSYSEFNQQTSQYQSHQIVQQQQQQQQHHYLSSKIQIPLLNQYANNNNNSSSFMKQQQQVTPQSTKRKPIPKITVVSNTSVEEKIRSLSPIIQCRHDVIPPSMNNSFVSQKNFSPPSLASPQLQFQYSSATATPTLFHQHQQPQQQHPFSTTNRNNGNFMVQTTYLPPMQQPMFSLPKRISQPIQLPVTIAAAAPVVIQNSQHVPSIIEEESDQSLTSASQIGQKSAKNESLSNEQIKTTNEQNSFNDLKFKQYSDTSLHFVNNHVGQATPINNIYQNTTNSAVVIQKQRYECENDSQQSEVDRPVMGSPIYHNSSTFNFDFSSSSTKPIQQNTHQIFPRVSEGSKAELSLEAEEKNQLTEEFSKQIKDISDLDTRLQNALQNNRNLGGGAFM